MDDFVESSRSHIISRPLIGRKYECYMHCHCIEVIDVDELDEDKISARAENKTNKLG